MPLSAAVRAELEAAVGADHLISEPEQLRTYNCDGLTGWRAMPELVVLAGSTADVQEIVQICARERVPFVARGAGTGLSGGALPVADGIVISLARMKRILEIDLASQRIVVEPGVTNLDVSKAVAGDGFFYAPDPSSQQVCTIGGNVAENSGGAHCLKNGFTVNHVTGLTVVLPDGEIVRARWQGARSGRPRPDGRVHRLGGNARDRHRDHAPRPAQARGRDDAARRLPFDRRGRRGGLRDHRGGDPARRDRDDGQADDRGGGAGLPSELSRGRRGVAPRRARRHHGPGRGGHGEPSIGSAARVAHSRCASPRDDAERALLWLGRKGAFPAMGRMSPDYYVQDGVVPRTKLPQVLHRIGELSREHGLQVGNVFHAGDGNLHPLVLYDAAKGETEAAKILAEAILSACLDAGGSLTGEHGVGVDKACSMPKMFSERDLEAFERLRRAFDPDGIANPGKVIPTPRLCGEVPGPYRQHPLELIGLAERF